MSRSPLPPPTQERVASVMSYDPATGEFFWTVNRRGRFARAGVRAGTRMRNGYIALLFDGRRCGAHQIAWLYMTGEWPPTEIDHINGNRADNRFSNLRLATVAQNRCNSRARKILKGITKNSSNTWSAQITVNKKRIYLGSFSDPQLAHEAYWEAAQKYHGEFARKG